MPETIVLGFRDKAACPPLQLEVAFCSDTARRPLRTASVFLVGNEVQHRTLQLDGHACGRDLMETPTRTTLSGTLTLPCVAIRRDGKRASARSWPVLRAVCHARATARRARLALPRATQLAFHEVNTVLCRNTCHCVRESRRRKEGFRDH